MKGILKHKSYSNTTELYSYTQPSPGWPGLCQGHRLLVRLATVLEKSSEKKHIPLLWLSVAVIFDSAFIKLWVCVIKSNFLSWAIRPVFADPVTYHACNSSNIIHAATAISCM